MGRYSSAGIEEGVEVQEGGYLESPRRIRSRMKAICACVDGVVETGGI